MGETRDPIGVVLAGGAGRRIGGAKAALALDGTPLIAYPIAALREALGDVAVVVKRTTELPALPGVAIWIEPDAPRHPLLGVVEALRRADGRAVLVCAADMPFVTAALVRELATVDACGAAAVVPRAGGRLQPLLARYEPAALAALEAALAAAGSLTDVVARLGPQVLDVADERPFFNVNAPEDLLLASALRQHDA